MEMMVTRLKKTVPAMAQPSHHTKLAMRAKKKMMMKKTIEAKVCNLWKIAMLELCTKRGLTHVEKGAGRAQILLPFMAVVSPVKRATTVGIITAKKGAIAKKGGSKTM